MASTLPVTGEKTEPLIKIQHISKRYRKVHALRDFSLEIPRGTIYGLIGPNGAGKTTLMRILAALLIPTSGEVWFGKQEIEQSPTLIQRKVGYMPDFFGVYPDLTATEYLEFYAGIHGIPRKKRAGIVADLLELVDLSAKRNEYVDALSRGMKQRLCLARALVHDPEVLILDEPASGLDPRARIELRELVRTLQSMGKTILISSHILLELAEMCTNIAIMQAGQLMIAGDVDSVLRQSSGSRRIEIRILEEERRADTIAILQKFADISNITEDEDTILQADFAGDDQELHHILADLIGQGIPVISFAPRSGGGRLEEVFMSITEGNEQS